MPACRSSAATASSVAACCTAAPILRSAWPEAAKKRASRGVTTAFSPPSATSVARSPVSHVCDEAAARD